MAFGLLEFAKPVANRDAEPCEAAAPGLGCPELTKPDESAIKAGPLLLTLFAMLADV